MIVYTSANGTVIGWVYGESESDLQGITRLPSGADYAVFIPDTDNPNTANNAGIYTMTNITPSATFYVPTATGTLTFTELSAAEQLAHSQSSQIASIRAGYTQTMAGGFNVTIGGTQYTFGWSTDDKANLLATQDALTAGDLTFPVQYSDIHGSPVNIPDQATLDTVKATASRFFNLNHQQVLSLIGQVQAQTSVPSTPVTWSAATY